MEEVTFDNVQELLDSCRKPEEVFDYFGIFYDGFSQIRLNGKWNFIDKNGKILSPNQWFDSIGCFHKGFAYVKFEEKQGFIDKNGNLYNENKELLNENVNMEKETIFNNKVFQDFLDYLDNATPEQLEEDLKQIEQLNKYGPLMGDLLKEALDKNKEQETIKCPETYPFNLYNDPYKPLQYLEPDGHGGFRLRRIFDDGATTISTNKIINGDEV